MPNLTTRSDSHPLIFASQMSQPPSSSMPPVNDEPASGGDNASGRTLTRDEKKREAENKCKRQETAEIMKNMSEYIINNPQQLSRPEFEPIRNLL